MLNAKIKASINESVLCWLASVSEDGEPNVSPKEVFTYYGDETLIIANIASPQSVKNVSICHKVCVSFINIFSQKGYKLKGEAVVLSPNDLAYKDMHSVLFAIAGENFPIQNIISVQVKNVSPIVAPSYRFFPETTQKQQIESACKTYGVSMTGKQKKIEQA